VLPSPKGSADRPDAITMPDLGLISRDLVAIWKKSFSGRVLREIVTIG